MDFVLSNSDADSDCIPNPGRQNLLQMKDREVDESDRPSQGDDP